MPNYKNRPSENNYSIIIYFISTLFMIFISVHAIQEWPSIWAQITISLACILPALALLANKWQDITPYKKWPAEIKFVLVIVILGILNICLSEDQVATFKGMGLFLISGILAFSTSYFSFNSKQVQMSFFYLCSFCFIILLGCGVFEVIQQINFLERKILLFSSNPIPAGSLLILLSIGPMMLLGQVKNNWRKIFWAFCLFSGALLIILIAKRGPVLALIVMAFLGMMIKQKKPQVFLLTALVLIGIGYQFRDAIPPQFNKQLLKEKSLLVRMELHHVALDVFREKPIFGIGFNSSLSRFIPFDYESKSYSSDKETSFHNLLGGMHVFDNMVLSFLGESGGLFTLAYIGLFAYLIKNINLAGKSNPDIRMQACLLAVVLAGFGVHSVTFDSLKYPHLNWIFHSLLGMTAQCKVFEEEKI